MEKYAIISIVCIIVPVGYTTILQVVKGVAMKMAAQQSSEYKTFIQLTDELTTALSHDLTNIAGKLLAKNVITVTVYDMVIEAQSPGVTNKDKASRLIACVRDKVKSNPEAFSIFMEVLQDGDPYLEDTIKQLSHCLKRFSKSLCNLVLDFCRDRTQILYKYIWQCKCWNVWRLIMATHSIIVCTWTMLAPLDLRALHYQECVTPT